MIFFIHCSLLCGVLRHRTSSSGVLRRYLINNFVLCLTQASSRGVLRHLLRILFGLASSSELFVQLLWHYFERHCSSISEGGVLRHYLPFVALSLVLFCIRFVSSCHLRKFFALFPSLSMTIFLTPLNQKEFLRSSVGLL